MFGRFERAAVLAGAPYAPGLAPHVAEAMDRRSELERFNPAMFQAGVELRGLLGEWDGVSPREKGNNLSFLDSVGNIFLETISKQPFLHETKPIRRKTRKRQPWQVFKAVILRGSAPEDQNAYRIYDHLHFRMRAGALVLEHKQKSPEISNLPGGVSQRIEFRPSEIKDRFGRYSGEFITNPTYTTQGSTNGYSFGRHSVSGQEAQRAAGLAYRLVESVAEIIK